MTHILTIMIEKEGTQFVASDGLTARQAILALRAVEDVLRDKLAEERVKAQIKAEATASSAGEVVT